MLCTCKQWRKSLKNVQKRGHCSLLSPIKELVVFLIEDGKDPEITLLSVTEESTGVENSFSSCKIFEVQWNNVPWINNTLI